MSHFTVGVISKNKVDYIGEELRIFGGKRKKYDDKEVSELLQPYHEYECTGQNDKYVRDVDITASALEKFEEYKNEYSYIEFLDSWYGLGLEHIVEDELLIDRNSTHKYGYLLKEDGKITKVINRTNPNSKWDWWVIGGRWSDLIKTINGDKVDTARISDIDWTIDEEAYNKSIRFWEVVVEEAELLDHESKEDFWSFYTKKYFLNRYSNKEAYATEINELGTFALLTPDKEWIEKGEMHWFGVSDDTKESSTEYRSTFKDILNKYPDYYFTVVDCHI